MATIIILKVVIIITPKAVSEIKVPILLIHGLGGGDNTPEESMNELVAHLKTRYEIKILDSTPHSGFNDEQAENLAGVIIEWLRKFRD